MSLSNEDQQVNPSPENILKILVATDCHLGFAEKDAIRGEDSFVTFEEILQLAVKNDVDFVLLGGDLFHESKPSPFCVFKCLELLKRYCLGDKPVAIEFLSDMSYNFQSLKNPIVNYEDPNLNVSIPVFSIHGNHDDPTGQKQISALDILATTGLINYFGRWNDLSQVEIRPILLKKGDTKLALYGLSHIKDERLARLFRDKKVVMKRPHGDDWFNMFVLHQNRAARGVKNFIPDTALPSFLDLVIWGHEHDCRIEPEKLENSIYISQPGSSVATSLAAGESIPKKVGLLQISGVKFQMIPLPLTTVRPFVIDDLVLEDITTDTYSMEKPSEQAIAQVKAKIERMIEDAISKYPGPNKPLPLIRLKVFYCHDNQQFNAVRVGMQFASRVANPDNIIKLNSLISKERKKKSNSNLDEDDFERFVNINEWATNVEDVVMKLFEDEKHRQAMTILTAKGLTEAVTRSIKYNDTEAINSIIESQYKKTLKQLCTMNPDPDKINDAIETLQLQRQANCENANPNPNGEQAENMLNDSDEDGPKIKVEDMRVDDLDVLILSSDDEMPSTSISANSKAKNKTSNTARGRGTRGTSGGRGSRGPRGARATRGLRGKNDSYESL